MLGTLQSVYPPAVRLSQYETALVKEELLPDLADQESALSES